MVRNTCSNCHEFVDRVEQNYCGNCGHKLRDDCYACRQELETESDQPFSVGDQFYVKSIRGKHFTVVNVGDNVVGCVDHNRNAVDIEVGNDTHIISYVSEQSIGFPEEIHDSDIVKQ